MSGGGNPGAEIPGSDTDDDKIVVGQDQGKQDLTAQLKPRAASQARGTSGDSRSH